MHYFKYLFICFYCVCEYGEHMAGLNVPSSQDKPVGSLLFSTFCGLRDSDAGVQAWMVRGLSCWALLLALDSIGIICALGWMAWIFHSCTVTELEMFQISELFWFYVSGLQMPTFCFMPSTSCPHSPSYDCSHGNMAWSADTCWLNDVMYIAFIDLILQSLCRSILFHSQREQKGQLETTLEDG